MTVKFEIGQTYKVDREYGEVITVLRRTEKSIWVRVDSGTEERRKIKTQGTTECFMLNTFTVIFAKGCMTETINKCDIEKQTDIEYRIVGAKVVFMPVSDSGEAIMPELLKHEVMSWHLASVKAQIKQAGYIIKKAASKKVSNDMITNDDINLLQELGIEI
jgi:hypothetical protein